MDDQREDYFDPKRSPQTNLPEQLETHNMPTEDVEITNGTK